MANHPFRPKNLGWLFTFAFILVLVGLASSIPSVRASLSGWLGLSVAPSNQMPAVSVTIVALTPPSLMAPPIPTPTQTNGAETVTASPTQTEPATTAIPVEISQLSPKVGWDILVPRHLPDGYKYESAYFDTNQQMVILTFLITRLLPGEADSSLTSTHSITLLQAQKNDFVPMQIAPSTAVEDIQVNGQPAVYAVGAWDTEFVKDRKDPNGGKMVSTWRNDLKVQNIYWQAGKVYLVLVTDDVAVSRQALIDMATSTGGY